MSANIDQVTPTRNLIDLNSHSSGDFGLEEYVLTAILDDILLVEYIDMTSDGDGVMRNGLYVPTNALTKAWRKGKVLIAGPKSQYVKKDDIVIFPNNLGVTVSNIEVDNYGTLKKGIFLNESRIFGICKEKNDNTKRSS